MIAATHTSAHNRCKQFRGDHHLQTNADILEDRETATATPFARNRRSPLRWVAVASAAPSAQQASSRKLDPGDDPRVGGTTLDWLAARRPPPVRAPRCSADYAVTPSSRAARMGRRLRTTASERRARQRLSLTPKETIGRGDPVLEGPPGPRHLGRRISPRNAVAVVTWASC
jgi:hypothetical protein